MNHSNRQGSSRIQQQGFTLLEVIVVLIIIGLTSSWAIPNFHRSLLQGKVDRYMRNVESGLFSLRARMGAIKGSCLIDFGERRRAAALVDLLPQLLGLGLGAPLEEGAAVHLVGGLLGLGPQLGDGL